MKRTLYWIRNDHRLHDNQALTSYCQSAEGLVLWCSTPSLLRAGPQRARFYRESLNEFMRNLQTHKQNVLFFDDPIENVFATVIAPFQIDTIVYSKEVGTEEEASEAFILKYAQDHGIKVMSCFQDTLLERDDYSDLLIKFPKIFTEFRKKVEQSLLIREPLPAPEKWPKPIDCELKPPTLTKEAACYAIPALPGEVQGLQRLKSYFWELDRAKTYKETRNGMLDWNDSTKFSLWLANGSLSPRTIYQELRKYENEVVKNESTYWIFFELLWRDYFKFYLQKEGRSLFIRDRYKYPVDQQSRNQFEQWCQGKTGDDFIDANMRELLQTGWMSNRGRQNVASFLAKKWQLPWQWGAEWFEKQLLDYDVASNWGNWSYFSGVGSDPRDRMFNTATQAKHYDPDGTYRKRWLGEL